MSSFAQTTPCQYHYNVESFEDISVRDNLRILIHGGAWDIPEQLQERHAKGVENALHKAIACFQSGGSGMDIIIAALDYLEEDPVFDAGKGSFLNEYGEVELDAGVMEGKDLNAGAVASVRNILHPGRLARDVMEKTRHSLLVGQGAEEFAIKCGYDILSPDDLVDPRERIVFDQWVAAGKPDTKIFFSNAHADMLNNQEQGSTAGSEPEKRGTVGVVVALRNKENTDQWHVFAGTSTGGTAGKMRGRVGDVPIIGAGVYADDEGAAISCTGWGEGLMRIAAGQRVSAAVRAGIPLQQAVEDTLKDLKRRIDGYAGIIAVDHKGNIAASHTTPFMAFAGPKSCITKLD